MTLEVALLTQQRMRLRSAARWLGSVLALLVGTAAAAAPTASTPNIVLIVADDLGYSDLGSFGGEIATPNLDRLASEGLRMTQFYNCSVCNPTRAGFLTGLYPRFVPGGRLAQGVQLRDDMVTLAEVLRAAGYATAMTGKWHLPGHPLDRGFEEYYGVMTGAADYFNPLQEDPAWLNHRRGTGYFVHNRTPVEQVPADFYATDAFTDHAEQQIQALASGTRPFFLHVAYTAPHYPLQARAEDMARYRGRYRAGYEVLRRERHDRLRALGLVRPEWTLPDPDRRLTAWRYDLEPTPWSEVADRNFESARMEAYAAMVDRMDQGIGRLLKAIAAAGASSRTLVVFFSDNGGCASDPAPEEYAAFKRGVVPGGPGSYLLPGPGWATAQSSPFRRYKTSTYEGGITTPMIVRWPARIAAGGRSDAVGHVVDLMPTFAEAAGARYPETRGPTRVLPSEGKSLIPAWTTGVEAERDLGWYAYGSRAFRSGKWKAVWWVTKETWELYDMEADRTETHDLAAREPARLQMLVDRWTEWSERVEIPPAHP